MEIELKLHPACLETECKKQYERMIKHYFDKKTTDERRQRLEKEMVPLHHFLNHADFPALRSHHPELSGIAAHSVVLCIDEEAMEDGTDLSLSMDDPEPSCSLLHHGFSIKVNGMTIIPIWKSVK